MTYHFFFYFKYRENNSRTEFTSGFLKMVAAGVDGCGVDFHGQQEEERNVEEKHVCRVCQGANETLSQHVGVCCLGVFEESPGGKHDLYMGNKL